MKRVFFWLMVLLVIVLGWAVIRSSSGIQLSFMTGELKTLEKGNLTIPIEATGTIEAKDRVDIKSEAGGTVEELPFEVGQMVKAGDLLARLDPEDEQRVVDIAQKALQQAELNAQRVLLLLYQSEQVDLPNAQARLEQLEAELKYAKWDYEEEKRLVEKGQSMEKGLLQLESRYKSLLAQEKQVEAEIDRAKSNIDLAKNQAEQAELSVAKAKDDLADAEERLKETRIVAPSDGMLVQLQVDKGSVITSGSRSLMGGTSLAILADVNELYVKTLVDEADIGRVREIAPPEARPGDDVLNEPDVLLEPTPVAKPESKESAADVSLSDQNAPSDDHAEEAGEDSDASTVTPPEPDEVEQEIETHMQSQVGRYVRISVEAFPEEVFVGVIDLIEPEPERGQVVVNYVVRIRLLQPQEVLQLDAKGALDDLKSQIPAGQKIVNANKLFLGMQANVHFISETRKNVVLVPNEAVRYVAGERGVYIPVDSVKTPGKKVPRFTPFRAGLDDGMNTQVVSGLEADQQV